MSKNDINNLGQYFTTKEVAKLMCSFIEKRVLPGGSILDPCIGKNIFFQTIKDNNYSLTGLEIDNTLMTKDIEKFYKQDRRTLLIEDFIAYNFDTKFDAIIMNPPYIRQEKISTEQKRNLYKISDTLGFKLSGKANLYIYFILKSLKLLKPNGLLVVITYDSWLYSSFGASFKKYLISNYDLQEIIHFKNWAFSNVDVGATIMIIKNTNRANSCNYLALKTPDDLSLIKNKAPYTKLSYSDLITFNDHLISKERINFDEKYFKKIKSYSVETPWRGVASPINKYFIFKTESMDGLSRAIKFTSIHNYQVTNENLVFVLSAPRTILNMGIANYIDNIKKIILMDKNLISIKNKIINNTYWYKFSLKDGGDIIFNYCFRNNIKFLFNTNRLPTMGNFYNLRINNNIYPLFAILNSSLTKYAFMGFAKNQGNGLKKIQLNKFNEVPILKLELFTEEEIVILSYLGKELSKASKDTNNIISKINELVLSRYSKASKQKLEFLNRVII